MNEVLQKTQYQNNIEKYYFKFESNSNHYNLSKYAKVTKLIKMIGLYKCILRF